ncbi:MAG TPA: type IV secretory system conjugative DNA transfer family protein [Blastocatellia bacterium]|nr:type IV secretory system conjugative DNA transfer family protein [Blastocatellia bacterium]
MKRSGKERIAKVVLWASGLSISAGVIGIFWPLILDFLGYDNSRESDDKRFHGLLCGYILAALSSLLLIAYNALSEDKTKKDYHGSAGFAAPEEIADLVKLNAEPLEAGRFAVASWEEQSRIELPRSVATRHVLVLGPSGAGKTRSFFIPNCAWTRGASFVATDPKGELWNWTSGFQPDPRRYAPREPESSECLNWIPLCTDAHLTRLVARAVMESDGTSRTDPFWIYAETAFLAALFAHATTFNQPTPAAAYDFLTTHSAEQLVRALLGSPSPVARQFANIFSQADARLRGSIVVAVATRLIFLSDRSVRRFTSASNEAPDFGVLRQSPIAVYWVLQENDVAALRPLSALFFTIMLHQLKAQDPVVPVTLFLDELANIGQIPEFASEVTVARGRDIALVLGIQSLAQLDALYGRANAQTIIDNAQTKIALAGLANDSAELISRELGDTTIMIPRVSHTDGGMRNSSVTRTEADSRRRLMTADEVRRLKEEEMIVIITNRRPLQLERFNYTAEPQTAPGRKLGEERTTVFNLPAEPAAELPKIDLPGFPN